MKRVTYDMLTKALRKLEEERIPATLTVTMPVGQWRQAISLCNLFRDGIRIDDGPQPSEIEKDHEHLLYLLAASTSLHLRCKEKDGCTACAARKLVSKRGREERDKRGMPRPH